MDHLLEKKKTQLFIKRVFDFIVSIIGLIILLPFFLIISLIIKLDSKGPVFFKQIRVGKDGKEFKILKFRTMVQDAEKKGMQITVGKDIRITKSGHVLRKTKIDELPQLINVLIGDMSFVGPRPEVPKYVKLYDVNQRNILKVRPGITDYASIEYKNESDILALSDDPETAYIKTIMVEKLSLNLKYLSNMSLFTDAKLIFLTIFKIIR
ncbi:sugar transferase [Paenibacillus montanisoli]|uniref:Sugar transferase n=2 Tax=Paenibacillus montanisoli TaxID=2081970 RepID=A0A328U938_9BACL|nr:sugar transferase [Paenibacillus montanisoli]